jgi:hypothetical protein
VQLCASTVTIASVVKHSPGSVGARHRLVADPLAGLLAAWVAKKAIAVVEADDEVWTVPRRLSPCVRRWSGPLAP